LILPVFSVWDKD